MLLSQDRRRDQYADLTSIGKGPDRSSMISAVALSWSAVSVYGKALTNDS